LVLSSLRFDQVLTQSLIEDLKKIYIYIPGSFRGLRKGTNFAPMPNAIEGPNMNPLASIPTCKSSALIINTNQPKETTSAIAIKST